MAVPNEIRYMYTNKKNLNPLHAFPAPGPQNLDKLDFISVPLFPLYMN